MERILVIDDDALNLKMADSILRKTYEVICVKSGREGIDILHQKRIDLVFLDLYMPQMSGMETLERIRADAGISDTKVVVLTSSGNKSDVMGAIRLGALDFIKKPFFPVELLQRIKAILQTHRRDQILVVDDDKMNLMMAKKVLETQYDVFCAALRRRGRAVFYHRRHDRCFCGAGAAWRLTSGGGFYTLYKLPHTL